MKRSMFAFLLLLVAGRVPCQAAGEQLIPAGSLIQCTVAEPKLSSKTADIGDPVLCQVSHVERYGRTTLPYGSYLVGRFEDYRDPGHLVGKGWMELRFDRMVIQPDTVIPLAAKVVYVPGYQVDRMGRILGKGHAVKDTIDWLIPVLWPLDLINLPRRGPRPTLKEETRLTLKVMDDLGVPTGGPEPERTDSGLYRRPTAYIPPPQPQPPIVQNYITTPTVVVPAPAPIVYAYPRPGYAFAGPRGSVVIVRNGPPYPAYRSINPY